MTAQPASDKTLYLRLLQYLKPYQGRFVLAILTSIPSSALNGLIAWLVGPFLDDMISGKDSEYLFLIPVGIIVVSLLQGLFDYLSNYYNNFLSFAISRDIRLDLYKQLNKMDMLYFKTNSTGDLISRYYSDPSTLQKAIVTNLQGFVVQFFTALFLASVLIYRNWQLSLIAIGIISLIIFPLSIISKKFAAWIIRLGKLRRSLPTFCMNLFLVLRKSFRLIAEAIN